MSVDRPSGLQLRFSNSAARRAVMPISVVQTGVKSAGWLKKEDPGIASPFVQADRAGGGVDGKIGGRCRRCAGSWSWLLCLGDTLLAGRMISGIIQLLGLLNRIFLRRTNADFDAKMVPARDQAKFTYIYHHIDWRAFRSNRALPSDRPRLAPRPYHWPDRQKPCLATGIPCPIDHRGNGRV